MAYKPQHIKIMSYNVHGSLHLGNLSLFLGVFKPGVVFLQEVKITSEQLSAFGRRLGYSGAANIDDLDRCKPGTGMLWHSSLPVSQVVPLYPCRIQVAMLGAYPLVNVYVPAGSHRAQERRHFFTEQLFGLLAGQDDILPIMGGDWNCVTEKIDLENSKYFDDRKSLDLTNILRDFDMVDAFRHVHGRKKEFTWQGRDGASASRLDRFYLPRGLVGQVVGMSHHASYSDHKFGMLELDMENVTRLPKRLTFDSGYWKLNNQILKDEDFMLNFGKLWAELVKDQGKYLDLADWWDLVFKPEVKTFLQNFSATRSRTRKQLKAFLCDSLDKALADKDWGEVAMARGRLQQMLYLDNMGFIIRSRFKENHEVERASLYHMNKEKKNAQGCNLEKLCINGNIETNREKVESTVTGFFGGLLSGCNGRNGVVTEEPFQPDFSHLDKFLDDLAKLSPESRDLIEKPINEADLDIALEKAANGRSPGLDGLSYEFYKQVKETVKGTMVEVLNAQLERLKIMESNRHGATRLTPKTEPGVIPRVDQLRPITLLCCDYKLLTSILSTRLVRVLGEVITSGQLCTVPGKNIHYGTHNLLSANMYLEERVKYAVEEFGYHRDKAGGAVLLSYDLFKAYDRVSIPYLLKVMAAMGFGSKFISWIEMLHEGATTCFILNFLTKSVPVLISVRQGDPVAMCLFLLFIEPLLIRIRKETGGLAVMGITCSLGDSGKQPHHLFQGKGERCALQQDEDYVDDLNTLVECPEDMVVIDDIFAEFELCSGAILNRSEKTKLLGLGSFEGRRHWPLSWIKVVKSLRIFGVTHFPTYKETLEFNWAEAVRKLVTCLISWNTRVLNSVFQRVQVLNTFALPKLWFLGECLPLPTAVAAEIDKHVYNFVKLGKMELPALEQLYAPVSQGGLGLVCVRAKADSLFLKQTLRMMSQPGTLHWNYIKIFAGKYFKIGEMRGCEHHCITPYYQHMVDLYIEGTVMEICHHCYHCSDTKCKDKKLKTTAKEIYEAYTDTFPPPRVEYNPVYRNVSSTMWGRVWTRVDSPMLDPMARQVVWRGINNVLPTRDRAVRLGLRDRDSGQLQNAICNRCTLRALDSVTHMFTECGLVREAWCWVRMRLLDLLPDDMNDLSNMEFVMMMFPKERFEDEMVWLMGSYMNYVYEEAVGKGRVLADSHVKGYLQYMYFQSLGMNMPQLGYIPEVTVSRNLVFDNG